MNRTLRIGKDGKDAAIAPVAVRSERQKAALRAGATGFALWLGALACQGQLTINVGSFDLPAETSTTAAIEIKVNNPDTAAPVGSLDFGIEVQAGGPKIKSVDLLSGTIWEFNHTGPTPSGLNDDHRKFFSLTRDITQDAPSLSNGLNLVARVTFDTTSVAAASYALKLVDTSFGPTGDTVFSDPDGSALPMNVQNGTLTVVPEPGAASIAIGCGLLALALARSSLPRCRRA